MGRKGLPVHALLPKTTSTLHFEPYLIAPSAVQPKIPREKENWNFAMCIFTASGTKPLKQMLKFLVKQFGIMIP